MDFTTKGLGFVHHTDFPERYVRERDPRGWQVCDICQKNFKLWMTSYQNWEKLPKSFRDSFLCVACYRKLVDATKRAETDPKVKQALRTMGQYARAVDESGRPWW